MTFTIKDEIFFKNNGYLIKKTKNLKDLAYLKNKVLELIIKKNKKLSKFQHDEKIFLNFKSYVGLKEINKLRVAIIKKINLDNEFSEKYYAVAKEMLDFLVGNELAIQKKINLSIQAPKDSDSMLPMHSDIYAGESPFEVVVWIPLTDVQANSQSMFITSPKKNSAINKAVNNSKNLTILQIYKKFKNKFKFLKINYGEVLIFSPVLLHGNVINKTDKTRISLNCRFKSLLSPYDVFNKTHRNIPHFFKPLNIKPMTKVGFSFIKTINEKN